MPSQSEQDRNVLSTLHPACKSRFMGFYEAIIRTPDLSFVRPYEAHRTPEKQEQVRVAGSSKVGAWRSVHQYGFACDFVPCPGGKWTWDWDGWDRLHTLAEDFGLYAPISWDRPHIVSRGWKADLRVWLLDNAFT